MDVSVIIVSYNTAVLLRDCIRSVQEHTAGIRYEIIVVDNDSRDGSPDMVKQEFPDATLIQNRTNEGFGKANNAGYRLARGKYILFLKSDTHLISNAMRAFYEFMERPENTDVYACGGKLLQKDRTPAKSYGHFPSLLEIMVTAVKVDRLLSDSIKDRISTGVVPKSPVPIDVDYIVGADLFLRASAVASGLLFDEDFFLYFEETELCYRLKRKGMRAVIIPDIGIIHLEGQSSRETNYTLYGASRILFLKKCRGVFIAAAVKYALMSFCMMRYVMTCKNKYLQRFVFYRGL